LWAPPSPTFGDRRAADAMLVCLVILLHFSMTNKILRIQRKFLGNLLKNFLAAHAKFFGPADQNLPARRRRHNDVSARLYWGKP